jgi:plasmid stabilization system protein ParE
MKKLEIKVTAQARTDLREISYKIINDYKTPLKASQYFHGLFAEIMKLSTSAKMHKIQTHSSLLQYGYNVRRVNYRKLAIIYTLNVEIVYVHRIIASTLISIL